MLSSDESRQNGAGLQESIRRVCRYGQIDCVGPCEDNIAPQKGFRFCILEMVDVVSLDHQCQKDFTFR